MKKMTARDLLKLKRTFIEYYNLNLERLNDEVTQSVISYEQHIKQIPLATMLETDNITTLTSICVSETDVFNFALDVLLSTKIMTFTDDMDSNSFEHLVSSNVLLNCANELCSIHIGVLKQIELLSSLDTTEKDIQTLLKSNPIISFCLMVKLFK